MADPIGENIIAARELAWKEVTSQLTKNYGVLMMSLYGLGFGYLSLLWAEAAWAGSGVIVITMWFTLALVTIPYFFWGSSITLAKKVTGKQLLNGWCYLLLFVVVSGDMAIMMHAFGAPLGFPIVMLAIFTMVIRALYLGGTDMERPLSLIVATTVLIAMLGSFFAADSRTLARIGISTAAGKVHADEQSALEIATNDVAVQEKIRLRQLRGVNALMQCKLPQNSNGEVKAPWNAEQQEVYKKSCAEVGGISLSQLKKYWVDGWEAWERSYGNKVPIVPGRGPNDPPLPSFLDDPQGWAKANPSWALGLMLHIPALILLRRRTTTEVASTATSTTKKVEEKSETNWWMWAFLLLLVVAIWWGWTGGKKPDISIARSFQSAESADAYAMPVLSALSSKKDWRASMKDLNAHYPLQGPWGQFAELREGSYASGSIMRIEIIDPNDPSFSLKISGDGCTRGGMECVGMWDMGHGRTGAARGHWENNLKSMYIELFLENQIGWNPLTRSETSFPIKGIRIVRRE
jgi:hypothetical protein